MARVIRGALGRVLLVILALIAVGTAYVVFIQVPSDALFWKAAFTLIVLAVTLTSAVVSSLTLGTRYVLAGVMGMVASFVGAVSLISSLWTGNSSSPAPGGLPFNSVEALGHLVPSEGTPIGTGFTFIVVLATLALPLINAVLYFAYESNPVGETLGIVTVAAILGNIVLTGVTVASQSGSQGTAKWIIFLCVIAIIGIIGTPIAASFDSDAKNYASRQGVHYDIPAGGLPSVLPSSYQTKKRSSAVTAQDDPPMPHLDYRP